MQPAEPGKPRKQMGSDLDYRRAQKRVLLSNGWKSRRGKSRSHVAWMAGGDGNITFRSLSIGKGQRCRPGQMNLFFNKYYVIKEHSRHYFPKASCFKLKEYDRWPSISHRQQLFLLYIPCNFTIRAEIPTRVIILAMLKPVDKRESSALVRVILLPYREEVQTPKWGHLWQSLPFAL